MMIFREGVQISKSSWPGNDEDAYAVAEAVLSPAKYALLQFLGYKLLNLTFSVNDSGLSSATSIKVGAWGGAVLTFVHLFVLASRRDNLRNDASIHHMVCKEMLCSAVGSIFGAMSCGLMNNLSIFATAGFIGPAVFLVILFGPICVAMAIRWIIERWWKRR
uniref:Uncharacterized protein n=1 Tax=Psilocybe cubensis TaxID=181762 RepID=A0A8H8CME4_PSICU